MKAINPEKRKVPRLPNSLRPLHQGCNAGGHIQPLGGRFGSKGIAPSAGLFSPKSGQVADDVSDPAVNGMHIITVERLLLEKPETKITALAEEAGFSSNATFYRRFAALTGLSPDAWRKQQGRKME